MLLVKLILSIHYIHLIQIVIDFYLWIRKHKHNKVQRNIHNRNTKGIKAEVGVRVGVEIEIEVEVGIEIEVEVEVEVEVEAIVVVAQVNIIKRDQNQSSKWIDLH